MATWILKTAALACLGGALFIGKPTAALAQAKRGVAPVSDIEQAALDFFADSMIRIPELLHTVIYFPDTVISTRSSYVAIAKCYVDRKLDTLVMLEQRGRLVSRALSYPLAVKAPDAFIHRPLPENYKPTVRQVTMFSYLRQGAKLFHVQFLILNPTLDEAQMAIVTLDENRKVVKTCISPL